MKTSIFEICVALLLGIILFLIFVKFVVVRIYSKYKYEIDNKAVLFYTLSIIIMFVLLLTAVIEPAFNSYQIMKMNTSSSIWIAYAPLLGQFFILIVMTCLFLFYLSKYTFKWFFFREEIHSLMANKEKTSILLFVFILISLTMIARYFIIQIGLQLVPMNQTIF